MALASLGCWNQLLSGGFSLGVCCPPLPQGQEGGANLRRAIPGSLGCFDGSWREHMTQRFSWQVQTDGLYDCMSGAERLMSR